MLWTIVPTRERVTRNVEALLQQARHTQQDLALTMRIDRGNVSRKLNHVATWTLDDLDRVALHFGITVAELVSVNYEQTQWTRHAAG